MQHAQEPIHPTKTVQVTGLSRQHASVVDQELVAVRGARTFGQLVAALDAAVAELEATDLFERVTARVGRAAPPALDGAAPDMEAVRVGDAPRGETVSVRPAARCSSGAARV